MKSLSRDMIFKINLIVVLTFFYFSASSSELNKNPTDNNPRYIRTQFAGNMGLLSVGMGREYYTSRLLIDLDYGYLPSFVNGTDVHTFAIKSEIKLFHLIIDPVKTAFHVGSSFTYSITDNTYTSYPDYYPSNYYSSNAFHLNPFIGAAIELPYFFSNLESIWFYSELGTVDYKLWYCIKNKTIDIDEIWNLCFGMTFHLK